MVLTAGIVAISTRTVLADTPLSRPAGAAAPVASATPALLASQKPAEIAPSPELRGVASWYGGRFDGRLTASGERFNMYAMTACHNTLPFGSVVRVTDLDSHKSVVVRITDRGYLYNGRIMDLSYGAARKLGMIKPGLARVKLEVLYLGRSRRRHAND